MSNKNKNAGFDIIDSYFDLPKAISQKDSLQQKEIKTQKSKSTLGPPSKSFYTSSSVIETKVSNENQAEFHSPTMPFEIFKNEIKSMTYSEKIQACVSNTIYNMTTFQRGGLRAVRIKSEAAQSQARLFNQEYVYDPNHPNLAESLFNQDHSRIIWFSYRKNFPKIRSQNVNESQSSSNDLGWGCMIRCSQMLLAQTLKRHFSADYQFLFSVASISQQRSFLISIIRLFLDYPLSLLKPQLIPSDQDDYSLFGIQSICKHSLKKQYQSSVKSWHTSISVCTVLSEILEEKQKDLPTQTGLSIINFNEQIIFLKELEEAIQEPSTQQHQIEKPKKSTLILIHMKFGESKFSMKHAGYFQELMCIPEFVGALTGTDTKGMYIVGYQNSHVIVLDPHFVQESTIGEKNLENDFSTYFNTNSRSILLESLSSDISLGFYINILENNAIDAFINTILDINQKYEDPLLTVLSKRDEIPDDLDDTEANSLFMPLPQVIQQIDASEPLFNDFLDTTQVFPLNNQHEQKQPTAEQDQNKQTQDHNEEESYEFNVIETTVQSTASNLKKQETYLSELLNPMDENASLLNQQNNEDTIIPNEDHHDIPQNPATLQQQHSPWGGPDPEMLATEEFNYNVQKKKTRAYSDFEMLI